AHCRPRGDRAGRRRYAVQLHRVEYAVGRTAPAGGGAAILRPRRDGRRTVDRKDHGRAAARRIRIVAAAACRLRPGLRRGVHARVSLHPGRMTSPGTRQADAPSRVFDWLLLLAIVAVAGTYVRAISFTPYERLQGP